MTSGRLPRRRSRRSARRTAHGACAPTAWRCRAAHREVGSAPLGVALGADTDDSHGAALAGHGGLLSVGSTPLRPLEALAPPARRRGLSRPATRGCARLRGVHAALQRQGGRLRVLQDVPPWGDRAGSTRERVLDAMGGGATAGCRRPTTGRARMLCAAEGRRSTAPRWRVAAGERGGCGLRQLAGGARGRRPSRRRCRGTLAEHIHRSEPLFAHNCARQLRQNTCKGVDSGTHALHS